MVREIIEALQNNPVIKSYQISEYFEEESAEFIRLQVFIKDGSVLHVKEFSSLGKSKYSYNWQDTNGRLILRWDNSPHYPEMATFPYHLHEKGEIFPSDRVFINQVLEEITLRLK
jgi:hypothetical protein